jgi:hypothetical protein
VTGYAPLHPRALYDGRSRVDVAADVERSSMGQLVRFCAAVALATHAADRACPVGLRL